jgi:hypothetical protein
MLNLVQQLTLAFAYTSKTLKQVQGDRNFTSQLS